MRNMDVTTGWRITNGSVWAHYVVVPPGRGRVIRAAVCGRKGSTWHEAEAGQRCHECADLVGVA